MVFFGKKEQEVENLIFRHIRLVRQTLTEFARLMDDFLKGERQYQEEAYRIHSLEHAADSARRSVARKLAEGAFLPIHRGDYVILVELIDKIANAAEGASDLLVLTRPDVPEFMHDGLRSMTQATVECFEPVESLFEFFRKQQGEVFATAAKIEEKEQEIDAVLWDLSKALFKSELALAEKLLLKELIQRVGMISNRIEDVSDRFEIMTVKRSI